jgi:hypothetical protein
MKPIFLFGLLGMLILPACKKNKELQITIKGQVTHSTDGTPAAGIQVKFQYQGISNSTVTSAYTTLGSTTTDASGNYSYTFEKQAASKYRIQLNSSFHFAAESEEAADNFSATQDNIRNLNIAPLGWFSIRITNANPVNSSDQIIYQNNTEASNPVGCCNNNAIALTGTSIDTILICKRYGGSRVRFTWNVSKLTGNTNNTDSILCPKFDTAYYQLNY